MYFTTKTGWYVLEDDPKVPKHTLIVGASGCGKSMTMEAFANFYYENGYTIISVTDTKDNLEVAFSMFKPIEDYHLKFNEMCQIPIKSMPTKIYHPITFNIPNKKLPDINFYGFPMRFITRNQLKFIIESEQETDAMRILNYEINNMKPNQGLHHLIYYLEKKATKNQTNKRDLNPNSFFTKAGQGGTQKTVSQIITYFRPFIKDYFLLPNNNENNIDLKSIINDQEHYHVFTTKYIQDPKLKSLVINILIEQILLHAEEYAKHPICIILEEMKYLTPDKPEGYTTYLSNTIRNFYSISRSKGRGFASIGTTQEYFRLHPDIINSMSQILIGEMSGFKEIERIHKALSLTSTEMSKIKALSRGKYLTDGILTEDGNKGRFEDEFRTHLPFHRHAEIDYKFEEHYKKEYPEKMRRYDELLKNILITKQKIEEDVKKLVEVENKEEDQRRKEKQESKTKAIQEETKKIILTKNKIKEKDEKLGENMMKEYDEGNTSFQKLALKYGLPHKQKAMRMIQKARERQATKEISENISLEKPTSQEET